MLAVVPSGCRIKGKCRLRWRRASRLWFAGQRYDSATGLNYNMHRDYSSSDGRYLESDIVGLAGGISTYAYVSSQPTQWNDPLGLAQVGGIGRPSGNYSPGSGGNASQRRQIIREYLRGGQGDLGYLDDASQDITDEIVTSIKDIGVNSEYICLKVMCFRRKNPSLCTIGDGWFEQKFWSSVTLADVNRMKGCKCERIRHVSTYSEPQMDASDVAEILTRQLQLRNSTMSRTMSRGR
jgi:RHS repeat-associated protein